jgi:predicted Ser/Thr protein kinase
MDLGTRYVFERVLGRGGMGVVLRAQDTLLNRLVAVKLLSEELADNPEAQQIFLTESRALATLSHPNLVGIFDVTEIGGRAMMVFEYVEGETLDQLVRKNGRFAEAEALRVAIELTFAIEYLHQKNVIHRDLKPANIMVQPDGKVRLIDFGLARSLEDIAERGTRLRGSPAYMAPEQVMGEQLGHHTDLYALGMTLFEILAGRLPFESGDMSFAQVHRHPPSLATLREDLHADLVVIVDRCICKAQSDRPASALEVRNILTTIAADVAAGVRPSRSRLTVPSFPGVDFSTTGQDLSRNKGLVGVLGVITVVFIIAFVGILMMLKMIPMPGEEPDVVVATLPSPGVKPAAVQETLIEDGVREVMAQVRGGILAAETASDAVAEGLAGREKNRRPTRPVETTPKPEPVEEEAVEVVVPAEKPAGTFQPTKFGTPGVAVVPSAEADKADAQAKAAAKAKADALLQEKLRLEAAKKKAESKPAKVAPPVSF